MNMNYPVWPDSASYSRTLLGNGASMRSLAPPPPPTQAEDKSASKYNGGDPQQRSARMSSAGEECGGGGGGGGGGGSARGHQLPPAGPDKYAPLSSFTDDDSMLKVATQFLSGNGNAQGRHYMPIARDYSVGYSGAGTGNGSGAAGYCNSAPIERPGSARNPHASAEGSRISSASSSDNAGGATSAAGTGGQQQQQQQPANNSLMSPCSVMEEQASSPGSTASQLSYLGALQSNSSLTPLGFPAPYLLTKDGAGLAAAAAAAAAAAQAAHAAQHVGGVAQSGVAKQKKEPKPGSDVRSFGCQVCGRGFKQKATLAQHERTHTDERPFDCPDCHKRFRQQSHLVQHLRIHSDERPYGCTYCEKAFRQKAILNQHIRIHTGEKPYVCPQCTKCFRQKAILNQHIRTHSGKRPYSCPDAKCKKKFVDQASMEKHFKKHIEDDQQQMIAEARNPSSAGSMRASSARNSAKGLLRVKLNNSDRPAAFSRVLAPGAGGVSTQDRATSPFPINMMVRPGQNNNNNSSNANNNNNNNNNSTASGAPTPVGAASPERMSDTPISRLEMEAAQQPPAYLTHHGHHHHHQAATASGPYQFVPFPHRPYHYDLLGLGSMSQSMYSGGSSKMDQQGKYRAGDLGEASHQMDMDKDCSSNNNMATNYTVNGGVKNDGVP